MADVPEFLIPGKNIIKNSDVEFDPIVAELLKQTLPLGAVVVDTETTGNYVERHGMISLGALDLFNPAQNFSGVCHLRDGAYISAADITKNFGAEYLEAIINPHGKYPGLFDGNDPFIEPNFRGSPESVRKNQLHDYASLIRSAQAVLQNSIPHNHFIQTSLEDLAREFYTWLKHPQENSTGITLAKLEDGHPIVTPLGHNVAFDARYINDAFQRAGIGGGAANPLIIDWDPDDKSVPEDWKKVEHTIFRPFSFSYRILDSGQMVVDYITNVCVPEDAATFWNSSKTNTGQATPIPYLQGGHGISLDAAMEFVGLKPRPSTATPGQKKHDSMEDVYMTTEVIARIMTGMPYLSMFKDQPINTLASIEYRNNPDRFARRQESYASGIKRAEESIPEYAIMRTFANARSRK